jgi:phospholipase/carboxylesterase
MTFEYRHKFPSKPTGEKPPLLLLLHGFGADENDLFGIAPYLDKRFFIVSVRAPFSSPFGGYAWFEIYMEPGNISMNVKQYEESLSKLRPFIDELVIKHDLDADRIYLCGFSQGAMMTLSTALAEPQKFAGIVCMSGRSAPEMLPVGTNSEKLKGFPVLVTHGINDPLLPIENGRGTKEFLSRLPVDLEYKEYPMAHEISQESLTDVSNWLRLRLDG